MIDSSEKLKKAMLSGGAAHACLITGGDFESMGRLASECAALLLFGKEDTEKLKNSPDFFNLDGSAKIDELRDVRRELYKKTFGGRNRAVCIKNAHLMNANAVNAMLKMLEEPPDGTYFLLTGFEYGILPTIRSRCMIIRLGSGSRKETAEMLLSLGASPGEAKEYASYAGGSADDAVRLYRDEGCRKIREGALSAFFEMLSGALPFKWSKSLAKDRDAAKESIAFMLSACHDLMLIKCGLPADMNTDKRSALKNYASRFTFKQIGCIIDKLTAANMRLNTNAGVYQSLDGLIVEITEVK